METPSFIDVNALGKEYPTRNGNVEAIADLTFHAARGSFLTVLGPSGSGKTTLLKILAGLLPYTRGDVTIDGQRVDGPIGNVGMVFQRPALFQWRTVLGNVLAPLGLMGVNSKSYRDRAFEFLDLTGLSAFHDRYPHELSGGMQQRVSICRALIHDPAVLLMDEPFGALDAMTRDRMNLELQRIWQASGKTVVFITHSIEEAIFLGDRVLILSSRPSRVQEDLTVNIERPRTVDTRLSADFTEYVRHVQSFFELGEDGE